ncbi:MAG: hypothetical protein K0Q49_2099 [Haloplasmataceae bacterium]|jgi:hypothetical protein|nr:hypothetical protein [Haloplasmataceae bacterium]
MISQANSPELYINELPEERKVVIEKLRKAILDNLEGFDEIMAYGMINYVVPFSIYPAGYRCNHNEPVPFLSLASLHKKIM